MRQVMGHGGTRFTEDFVKGAVLRIKVGKDVCSSKVATVVDDTLMTLATPLRLPVRLPLFCPFPHPKPLATHLLSRHVVCSHASPFLGGGQFRWCVAIIPFPAILAHMWPAPCRACLTSTLPCMCGQHPAVHV